MAGECDQNCGSCSGSASCGGPVNMRVAPNADSQISCVIGVVSGKGGVGKSMIATVLSVLLQRSGLQTAVLDADITGPSVPKAFGIDHLRANGSERGILPIETKTGIRTMSVNLLLEDHLEPVVWRGPVIAGAVKQFWSEVVWGDIDIMLVDMPPGTGDVPLTVFQSLPVDGIVMVTSPQELVGEVVDKAARMAEKMNIPIVALVENYAWFECPDCGSRHVIFGDSHAAETAARHRIAMTIQVPIRPALAGLADRGDIESVDAPWLEPLAAELRRLAGVAGRQTAAEKISGS